MNYAMMSECYRIGLSGGCPAIADVCPEDCPGYEPPYYDSPKDIRLAYYKNGRK